MRKRLIAILVILLAQSATTPALGQEPAEPTPAPGATPTATATTAATPASPACEEMAKKTRFEISAVFSDDTQKTHDLGLRTTTTPAGWKVGIAADMFQQTGKRYYIPSPGTGSGVIDQLLEMDLGGRLSFTDEGAVRPWIGSGAGAFSVEGKMVPGLWAGFGVDVIVANTLDLGLLLHYATVHSPDFQGPQSDVELGSTTVGASAGLVF